MKILPRLELKTAKKEEPKRDYVFILPVKLDETLIADLHPDVIYLDHSEGLDKIVGNAKAIHGKKFGAARLTYNAEIYCVSYSVSIPVLLESGLYSLPGNVPSAYHALCDWLMREGLSEFEKLGFKDYAICEDYRDGEVFGFRIVFRWRNPEEPLDFSLQPWWGYSVDPVSQVYPDKDGETVLKTAQERY